jgi:hypothetical protein
LREKCRLTVFENTVLRRILRHEVMGEWRRLHKEELYALYCSTYIIQVRRLRWAGHVTSMGESRGAYSVWKT